MGASLNHHFVPKYLFRLFSDGESYIHLVTKSASRVIFGASIKGQCARHKFYGAEEIENYLAGLDSSHATAYHAAVREAWSDAPIGFSEDELYGLFQAVVLQHVRVPRTAEDFAYANEQMSLVAFREHIKATADDGMRDRIVEAIDRGQVKIKGLELMTLLNGIQIALSAMIAITDLHVAILRNFSQYPFIFGDAPCIFYNRYLHHIISRGVLGLQTPGLMILMPLNHGTQLLLYDPEAYTLRSEGVFVDLFQNADVSQLNALQIYAAKSNLYFSDEPSAEYLVEMINAHRPRFEDCFGKFRVHQSGTMLIDGKPNDGEVMHMFDRQLPIRLDLSVIETKPPPPDADSRRIRSPELRAELDDVGRKSMRGMPIDEFADQLRDELDGLPSD